jgi:hypothetical protein
VLRGLMLLGLTVPAGCVQPQPAISVDLAEAQCVRTVLDGSRSTVSIGVGAGTGFGYGGLGWDDYWGQGSGVGISTTVPVGSRNPEAAYTDCVIRKAGKPPDTPLAQRPEIVG